MRNLKNVWVSGVGLLALTLSGCSGMKSSFATPQAQTDAPTFKLVSSTPSVYLQAGGSQSVQVQVVPSNGFQETVAVSVAALPAGVTASPASLVVNPGASATLTLTAASNASSISSQISLKGLATSMESDVGMSLAVSGGGSPPNPGPGGGPGKTVVSNIEKMSGWQSCTTCAGPGGNGAPADSSITQNVASPSLDGASTQFFLGGTHPFSNVLNYKPLDGRAGATNLVLDFDVYIQDASVAQGLEMDIFYSRDGQKNYFLTECDSRGSNKGTWQVSDAVIDKWQHTGLPCKMNSFAWNHVTLEFLRQPDGNTRFVSVSMNGDKHYVNQTYSARLVSSFEMNAAIQLDGDENQDPWSVWVDRMSITYW